MGNINLFNETIFEQDHEETHFVDRRFHKVIFFQIELNEYSIEDS